MEKAQRATVRKIVGWAIFCVCLVIGALLGLGGTLYGIFVYSHPDAPGWGPFAIFLLMIWIFAVFIGWIGWAIKRSLTKADASTENQSLDGLWVARGTDWAAEIYVTGNSFDIDLTCTALATKYTGQGVIDDDGEVGYVKLRPFNVQTPTLTGTLELMQLNSMSFSCKRDEFQFARM